MASTKKNEMEASDDRTTATPNISKLELSSGPSGEKNLKVPTKRHGEVESSHSKKSKVVTTDEELDQADKLNRAVSMEDELTELMKDKFFQDRTLIIKDFVESTNEWVVDNKPYRFGKSTNVRIQVLYLSEFVPLKDRSLFEKLKIGAEKEFEEKFFKKCKVFYLDFSVNSEEHVFVHVLNAFEKCFNDVKKHLPNCDVAFDAEHPTRSYIDLMEFIGEKGKRFFFIDEYDSAFTELYQVFKHGSEADKLKAKFYATQIYALMATSYHAYYYRFFITGIVALEYEDLFSDHKMIFSQSYHVYNLPFRQYHLLSIDEFVDSNKFSTPPSEEEKDDLLKWYSGYTLISRNDVIGNHLNVYSIVKYFNSKDLRVYFDTSGCTRWLREFLKKEDVIVYINEILSATEDITVDLEDKPFFSGGSNSVKSILVHCGYLVLVLKEGDPRKFRVKIPNVETKIVLNSLVRSLLSTFLPPERTNAVRKRVYEAFVEGSESKLEEAIKEFYSSVQGVIRYEETYCLLLQNTLSAFEGMMCIPFNTPTRLGFCDGIFMYKDKGYVVDCKIVPPSRLPEQKTASPSAYNDFCIRESERLLTEAENKHTNQEYINALNPYPEISEKYRLLIACVQKRAFIKLIQIS